MPSYGCERAILIRKTIEAVVSVTWSRECQNFECQLKLILGLSGEVTSAIIVASKIFLLNVLMSR